MRTTETFTISLPPAMLDELERVRQEENRTRSELMREALRQYIERRYPAEKATKAELAAVRRGRAEFKRGDYITLEQLHDVLATRRHSKRKKGTRKVS